MKNRSSRLNIYAQLGLLLLALTGASAKRPNILFVCSDDISHASCYGYKFVNTPHFDSLAKKGLRFTRMYTPSSKCAPSRATILTGRNPWQLEGAANHKPVWPTKFKSFVEALDDNGYSVGFTGKGWNPGVHPEGRLLTGKEYNDVKVEKLPTRALFDSDYSANFKKFIAERMEGEPFFFWYGSKEAHRGYEYKSGVKAGKKFEDLDFLPTFWSDSEVVKHDILDYAVEVEYSDFHLGKILQCIEVMGELENTLVIATSDNGMPFPRYKGHPHEFATRIPFVVSWPGKIKNPGRNFDKFASFIDIAPTILEAAGVDAADSGMQSIEGKSLADVFEDEAAGRDYVLTGRERNDMCRPNGWGYPVRSYHEGNFVYMHNFEPNRWPSGTPESGWRDTDWGPTKAHILKDQRSEPAYQFCFGKRPQEEFYDVSSDPECLSNLAAKPEYLAHKERMKKAMFAELKRQGDTRAGAPGKVYDEYRAERIPEYDELVRKQREADKRRSR